VAQKERFANRDRQVGLQHEKAFTDRLDQIQGVDFAHDKRIPQGLQTHPPNGYVSLRPVFS
jgi:hypothetical protein